MARSSESRRRARTETSAALEAKYVAACAAVHSGTCKNLATAAKTFALPYHTLRRRYRHLSSSSSSAQSQDAPLLSDAQEKALCDWIQFLADTSPLSKQSIRVAASELSATLAAETRRTGKVALAPRAWVGGFFARHPDLAGVPVPDDDEDAVSTGTDTDSDSGDESMHSEDAEGTEDSEAGAGDVRSSEVASGPEGTLGLPVQVAGQRRNPFRASRAHTTAPVAAAPSRRKTRARGKPQKVDAKRLAEAEGRVFKLEKENRCLTDLKNMAQERCDYANQLVDVLQARVDELEAELEEREALERQRQEESMKALHVRSQNRPYDHDNLDVGSSVSHPRTDMINVAPNGHHTPAEPLPYFVHNAPYQYLPAYTQGHANVYQYYYPYGVAYAHAPYHT